MTMNLIKEGANGQLEFDFASLEALTSQQFVGFVLNEFHGFSGDVRFVGKEQMDYKSGTVSMYFRFIIGGGICFVLEYSRSVMGRERYESQRMVIGDVLKFADFYRGGEKQWLGQ